MRCHDAFVDLSESQMYIRQETRAWTALSTVWRRSKRVQLHRVWRRIEREVGPQKVDSTVQRTRGSFAETEVLSKMRFN